MNDQDIIEKNGLRFRIHIEDDGDHGAPWIENDGHGVVSGWTQRDKKPGERVLRTGHSSKRFYDVQASIAIAKRDGWGLGPDAVQWLAGKLGRAPTVAEITATAVENDFEYLRRWCNDEWRYVGVCVEQIDEDDQSLTDKYDHAVWAWNQTTTKAWSKRPTITSTRSSASMCAPRRRPSPKRSKWIIGTLAVSKQRWEHEPDT